MALTETASDPLDLESLLSAEEHAVAERTRAFAVGRVEPHIEEWWRDGGPPRELVEELGATGLLGMHLSGYGCSGESATAYGIACLELEAVDSSLRTIVSVQGSLVMYGFWRWGSEEQKEAWLPELAAGRSTGAFALTEPEAGSDPASMRTFARRQGGDWIISGHKAWITNGSVADVVLTWAQTDSGVCGFAVPAGAPGLTAVDVEGKHSLRASVTSHLELDEVRLPDSARLPGAAGLKAPLSCLNEARFGIVWGVMGAARSCFQTALEYSIERVQFGRPIASFQLNQAKLSQMAIALGQGSLLAFHLGRRKDSGLIRPEQVSLGKLANVDAARVIARGAREILGSAGISAEFPVMRHMNNLESVVTYEGTAEMHTLILAHALTGIPAFR